MNVTAITEIMRLIINMALNPFYTQINDYGQRELSLNPAFIFFWVIVIVIAFQYRRIARSRETLFGVKVKAVLRDTLLATLYGFLGGIFGSFLLYATGVSLSENEVLYLWPVAIALALIHPRFLCFSYAGGIISLSFLIFHYPVVRVPQLMGLVAVLHMIESLLILISGHLGATPVVLKDKTGRLVGGFTLQKFWPIPLAITVSGIGLQPIVAGLGYGDMALARKPVEKSRISAIYLSLFSLVLLFLSLLANGINIFTWLAALFSPLGHELVIYLSQNIEYKGKPLYIPPEKGVKILAVLPGSPADKAGIGTADIILAVNGIEVNTKDQLQYVTGLYGGNLTINFYSSENKLNRTTEIKANLQDKLGIITVPDGTEDSYVELKSRGLIGSWLGKLKKLVRG